jgi:DNA repair exonuclease SbcCD ATPase subunit
LIETIEIHMNMKASPIIFLFALLALFSCKSDTSNTEENQEIVRLRNEIRNLELAQAEKDALINESLELFNEIQENIARIQNKEVEIRLMAEGGKNNTNQREWMLQELQKIQFLREENARKIKSLNTQIQGKENQIGQLHQMIENLQERILAQDELILTLRNILVNQDEEYSKLFDAYMEQADLAEKSRKELSKAFYVYGSLDELKKNNVVVQTKGFIGMGKKSSLKDGFNEDYFTPIDKFEKKNILIVGKKIQIISDHPSSSFTIIDNGNNKNISISNPYEFWKISKYLVVVVE